MLTQEQRREAEEYLVRGMADVGRQMEKEKEMRFKWDLALSELPNILRLETCLVPGDQEMLEGLSVLSISLQQVGHLRGYLVVSKKVCLNPPAGWRQ
jgi:hypothetical protein